MIDDSWYRRPAGVPVRALAGGVVLCDEGGRLLVALIREGSQVGYSLPKGHLESGETPEQAAHREVAEETGLLDLELLGPLGVKERLDFTKRAWNVTHYFAFRAPRGAQGSAAWFPLDALPEMFWPEQRDLIETHRGSLEAAAMKQAVRAQFTRRAGAYAGSASHARDDDLALLIPHLSLQPADRVLDVATGTGFTALAIREVAGFVVGLDFTPGMLEQAHRLARAPLTIRWVEGDAEALPFLPAAFSAVVVRRAPHHFPHVETAVREMLRVCAPGGRIGIVDQVPPEDPAGCALMETLERLRDPSHVRSLPVSEWRHLVTRCRGDVEFSQVVERPMPFSQWLDLAGADTTRVEQIEAALAAAPSGIRAQIGDTGQVPRMFLKRWVVLVARKSVSGQ